LLPAIEKNLQGPNGQEFCPSRLEICQNAIMVKKTSCRFFIIVRAVNSLTSLNTAFIISTAVENRLAR